MKIIFSKHVKDKLAEEDAISLGISGDKIITVIRNPIVVDRIKKPYRSIGEFSKELSLNVIWKIESGKIKVITFYPAEKGRYESKILRRR